MQIAYLYYLASWWSEHTESFSQTSILPIYSVQVLLQFLRVGIHFFAEGGFIKLILNRFMKPLPNVVLLGRTYFCFGVITILNG